VVAGRDARQRRAEDLDLARGRRNTGASLICGPLSRGGASDRQRDERDRRDTEEDRARLDRTHRDEELITARGPLQGRRLDPYKPREEAPGSPARCAHSLPTAGSPQAERPSELRARPVQSGPRRLVPASASSSASSSAMGQGDRPSRRDRVQQSREPTAEIRDSRVSPSWPRQPSTVRGNSEQARRAGDGYRNAQRNHCG
jgi:hypothetical protein